MDTLPTKIVLSTITQSNIQVDGRYTVTEIHEDDVGNSYEISYMANPDTDQNLHLANSAINFTTAFQAYIAALQGS